MEANTVKTSAWVKALLILSPVFLVGNFLLLTIIKKAYPELSHTATVLNGAVIMVFIGLILSFILNIIFLREIFGSAKTDTTEKVFWAMAFFTLWYISNLGYFIKRRKELVGNGTS
jgi:hypothetical protein